jgi:hypothetical protein
MAYQGSFGCITKHLIAMEIWNVGFKIAEFGCFEGTVHSALQVLWSLSVNL